jgi:hypothetical protein
MKKVFSSHSEVAEVWAQRSQSEGRATNVFFEGDTIYSWGRHVAMARWFKHAQTGEPAVLVTTDSYSVSTSKHQSIVRRAIPNTVRKVYVPTANATVEGNLARFQSQIRHQLALYPSKRLDSTRSRVAKHLFSLLTDAHAYCDAVGAEKPDWLLSPKLSVPALIMAYNLR